MSSGEARPADPLSFGDAEALAVWLSGVLRGAGLDVVGDPMVYVDTRDASVEIFDASVKQFILIVRDPSPA